MKRIVLALTLACFATPASARMAYVHDGPTEVVMQAPVARAIENISRDSRLSPAQRERLLGRLHLIAYVQAEARMTLFTNGEWQRDGVSPCGDPAFVRPAFCRYVTDRASPEIMDGRPQRRTPAALQHLRLSRTHYRNSINLDDTDLRAQLGLAYVLDELRQTEAARIELRRIARLALTRNGPAGLPQDDQAVVIETLAHLSDLAVSQSDRALIAELEQISEDGIIVTAITPIVVPLTDAPFGSLVATASPVAFDFAGTGDRRAQGWLTADAAWLVWDPEQRGEMRSGFDLIGQRTWAVFWRDGFEAMRALDDNRDGELTGAELGGLALWRDANGDGVSDAGEVRPVSDYGVVAFAVRGAAERPGLLTAPGGVRFADGARRDLYDWTPGFADRPSS